MKAKTIDLPDARKQLKDAQDFYEAEIMRANRRTDSAIEAFNDLQTLITTKVNQKIDPPSVFESPVFWGVTMALLGLGAGALIDHALE